MGKSLDWKPETLLSILSLEYVVVTRDWSLNSESHFSNLYNRRKYSDILQTKDSDCSLCKM